MKFIKVLALAFVCTIAGVSQTALAKGSTDHYDETQTEAGKTMKRKRMSVEPVNNAQNHRGLRRVRAHVYDPRSGQWVLPHQLSA